MDLPYNSPKFAIDQYKVHVVAAGFCFDTDVGHINISLIVILNATTKSCITQGN